MARLTCQAFLEGTVMEEGRANRKCPRIPAYLDVRVDLKDGTALKGKVTNPSTEGICIKADDPIFAREEITAEFLLPDASFLYAWVGKWCGTVLIKKLRQNRRGYIFPVSSFLI